ncbi:DUF805 domain-containing protein [Bradyrhizobium sp. AS23.2]|uniref:DUF805 domain-containing protein n=1 Tax=Bradyrhizobium sp. AS23.2 TaxID=1680155 RepID=UPI00093FD1EA|nr:DUF805 domain-containing protein [Bradyrhizobium sp. AS23.2]OKO67775.1 membrane protein [Bradyrhizobium sp. AS23.2]
MDWIWYLFRFDGRINRALLWQALLIVALLTAVQEVIVQVIGVLEGATSISPKIMLNFDFGLDDLFKVVDLRGYRLLPTADLPTLILKLFGTSLFFWIYLATAIKRLHDRDRSGWWIVPFFFAPRLLFYVWDLLPDSSWFIPFDWAIHALWLWGLVETFCLRDNVGDNRFGSDPLAEIEERFASTSSPAKSWDQQAELEIVPPNASPPGGMHVNRGS